MARQRPLTTEVVRRSDETFAKNHLPVAIDRDACRERIARIHQPGRQSQAVFGKIVRKSHHRGRCARLDAFAGRVVGAAIEHVRDPRLRQILHHHHLRQGGHQVVFFAPELSQRPEVPPVIRVDGGDVKIAQGLFLGGGAG